MTCRDHGVPIDMLNYQRCWPEAVCVTGDLGGQSRSWVAKKRRNPMPSDLHAGSPTPCGLWNPWLSDSMDLELDLGVVVGLRLPYRKHRLPLKTCACGESCLLRKSRRTRKMETGIFLDETREVVLNGSCCARTLAADPANLAEQTTLRRAFQHAQEARAWWASPTLARQPGIWQLLNTWLAERRPASDDLIINASTWQYGSWSVVEDIPSTSHSGAGLL